MSISNLLAPSVQSSRSHRRSSASATAVYHAVDLVHDYPHAVELHDLVFLLPENRSSIAVIHREITAVRHKTDHRSHDAHQPIGQVLFALLQERFEVIRALRGSLIGRQHGFQSEHTETVDQTGHTVRVVFARPQPIVLLVNPQNCPKTNGRAVDRLVVDLAEDKCLDKCEQSR
jgi:hypothetical protein